MALHGSMKRFDTIFTQQDNRCEVQLSIADGNKMLEEAPPLVIVTDIAGFGLTDACSHQQ